ncbi:MAG TPA: hypothetical protein VGH13_04335 [Xanthobacteraceae bacterium]
MINRRGFLAAASANLVCLSAPAFVPAAHLMRLSRNVRPERGQYFGFVYRLYVHSRARPIADLQGAGWSAPNIAGELNRRGPSAMNGAPWTARDVASVIDRARELRASRRYDPAVGRAFQINLDPGRNA